jgi:uncharacterized protein
VRLDAIGRAVPAGHRLRVSISPTGWPRAWPSPEPVTLTVVAGASHFELPVRLPGRDDASVPAFGEPELSTPLPLEQLGGGGADASVSFDGQTGRTVRSSSCSSGSGFRLPDGLEYKHGETNTFSIVEGEPLSASVHSEHEIAIGRGAWRTRVRARADLTCDATTFRVQTDLAAWEDDDQVLTREWSFEIPRDHV